MPDRDPQLLKGVLPMLVLLLLTEGESYGYELVTRLQADGRTDSAARTGSPVPAAMSVSPSACSRVTSSYPYDSPSVSSSRTSIGSTPLRSCGSRSGTQEGYTC